jgi:hypothetical protein
VDAHDANPSAAAATRHRRNIIIRRSPFLRGQTELET